MKKNRWTIMAVLVVALFVAVAAIAVPGGNAAKQMPGRGGGGMGMGQGGGMCGGMGGGMGGQMFERLLDDPEFQEAVGLSDTQVDKIKTLTRNSMKSMIRSKAEMQILQIELQDLLDADKPDTKKVDAKIDAIGKYHTQTLKDAVHLQIELKSMLTADQIEKAKDYVRTKMKERGGNKNKKHKGGGGKGAGHGQAPELNAPQE